MEAKYKAARSISSYLQDYLSTSPFSNFCSIFRSKNDRRCDYVGKMNNLFTIYFSSYDKYLISFEILQSYVLRVSIIF